MKEEKNVAFRALDSKEALRMQIMMKKVQTLAKRKPRKKEKLDLIMRRYEKRGEKYLEESL